MINNIIQKGGLKISQIFLISFVHLLLIFIFAGIYYGMRGNENFNGMDSTSSFFDALYFSFTTASSVGYGDISPKSSKAKGTVMIQQTIVILQLFTQVAELLDPEAVKTGIASMGKGMRYAAERTGRAGRYAAEQTGRAGRYAAGQAGRAGRYAQDRGRAGVRGARRGVASGLMSASRGTGRMAQSIHPGGY